MKRDTWKNVIFSRGNRTNIQVETNSYENRTIWIDLTVVCPQAGRQSQVSLRPIVMYPDLSIAWDGPWLCHLFVVWSTTNYLNPLS